MKNRKIGYLYINGLIDVRIKIVDKFVYWWWKRSGIDMQLAKVNWFDKAQIDVRIEKIVDQVNNMLKKYDQVTIIGSSAGGSLAINAFSRLKNNNVSVVLAHSRLKVGKYTNNQKLSLHHCAKIGKKMSAPSFVESVKMAEEKSIPNLSKNDKKRIMTMTQITDGVVPIETMVINGVRAIRTFAFGHRMGFLSHIFVSRYRIIDFVEKSHKIK